MVGLIAKERVDGKLVLPEAVQILKVNGTGEAGTAGTAETTAAGTAGTSTASTTKTSSSAKA